MRVSLSWLLIYVKELYFKLPDNLNFIEYKFVKDYISRLEIEIYEMWGFVGTKKINDEFGQFYVAQLDR